MNREWRNDGYISTDASRLHLGTVLDQEFAVLLMR
jgi:hypothetical protein